MFSVSHFYTIEQSYHFSFLRAVRPTVWFLAAVGRANCFDGSGFRFRYDILPERTNSRLRNRVRCAPLFSHCTSDTDKRAGTLMSCIYLVSIHNLFSVCKITLLDLSARVVL